MGTVGGGAVHDVAIVGAGAMGCLFGARLIEAGVAVTLIDSNVQRLEDIRSKGLVLTDDAGTRTMQPQTASAGEFPGPVDLVVLFTKGMYSAAAVRSVAHLAVRRPIALTLQNGLGNAEILAETFGADRVLKGTAHVPADWQPPNKVVTHGFADIDLGGHTPAAHALAATVGQLLTASGFDVKVRADIDVGVWNKLAFNAALNALATVTGSTNAGMDCPPGHRVSEAVVREVVAVAAAGGLQLDADHVIATALKALREHPGHKPSMLQDREAGRATEIESINGAVVALGQQRGVPTPVNATLADLVRLIEARAARA